MKPWIMILFLAACVGLLFASVATAGPCKGGVCSTVEVKASYEVKAHSNHSAAAGRSVGVVEKVAAVPVKAVAKITHAVRDREHKPVAKLLKATGRLRCHGHR